MLLRTRPDRLITRHGRCTLVLWTSLGSIGRRRLGECCRQGVIHRSDQMRRISLGRRDLVRRGSMLKVRFGEVSGSRWDTFGNGMYQDLVHKTLHRIDQAPNIAIVGASRCRDRHVEATWATFGPRQGSRVTGSNEPRARHRPQDEREHRGPIGRSGTEWSPGGLHRGDTDRHRRLQRRAGTTGGASADAALHR